MTATFFLVRHAAHDNVGGYLAGRAMGVHLGMEGRAQAQRLAQRMGRENFNAVYASPRERTQETAAAIGHVKGLPVKTAAALDEVDFGEWSGKTFDVLNEDAEWRRWNEQRDIARTPNGESMADVTARIVTLMEELRRRHFSGAVVLVSHADVIKAAVCDVLGLPASRGFRFEIAPASVTTIVSGDWGAKLLTLNEPAP
jgi:probable phosphoglycerate mutase